MSDITGAYTRSSLLFIARQGLVVGRRRSVGGALVQVTRFSSRSRLVKIRLRLNIASTLEIEKHTECIYALILLNVGARHSRIILSYEGSLIKEDTSRRQMRIFAVGPRLGGKVQYIDELRSLLILPQTTYDTSQAGTRDQS